MKHRDPHIVAVYQGSFDPVTFGHLDVIRRCTRVFSEVIVGIGVNPDKTQLFTPEERLRLLTPHLRQYGNVRAATYDGLTIDFVRKYGAHILVRGIRDMNDLSHEVQLANLNRIIGGVETVFMLTSDQHVLTSSTYIKQIMEMSDGGEERIRQLVPPNVVAALAKKLNFRPRSPRSRRAKRR